MKKLSILSLCVMSALLMGPTSVEAVKKKQFASEIEANLYMTEHFNQGCSLFNNQQWRNASDEFERVIFFFPCSEEASQAYYYLAICYFEMKEYDFANVEFSNYLKTSEHPIYFEDAFHYKYCIAEHLKSGRKRRPFKNRYIPKVLCGKDLALTIYDEVASALPNHDLAIQALYSKAELLRSMGEYRLCVDTYQLLIRRFPKNEIIPACYVNIADTYVEQSRYEFQNPDLLGLAELNARKFAEEYPQDEKIEIVNNSILIIKEYFAKGLCDLGLFYQRMKQPEAAKIYFQSAIEEYPNTNVADFCRTRMMSLSECVDTPCMDACLDETCIADETSECTES